MEQPIVNEIRSLRALHDSVLVTEMNFAERFTSSGIVLPNDNGKLSGVRARWARVYAVGPEQEHVQVGQWIYVAHGRWTRGVDIKDDQGVRTVRRVDNNDILLVSDEQPTDETISDRI